MFIKNVQKYNKFVIEMDEDKKIKEFLIQNLNFSVRSISKLKREKNLYLNSKAVKPTLKANKGDVLEILLNEEPSNYMANDLNIDVIYDDFDIIIVNKRPFMVVHPTRKYNIDTVANGLNYYIQKKEENFKLRFVNRLDMNTSGILVIAKNGYSHHILSDDMSKNIVDKKYIAVVEGVVKEDFGTIDEPIGLDPEDEIKRAVVEDGQRSITEYRVLERLENATIVQLKLLTGRTHQIRVHMKYLGHPLIGDELYNKKSDYINRQALHCSEMAFNQPRTKEKLIFNAKLPEDIEKLVEMLKRKGV